MSKNANASQLSPDTLAIGREVFADDYVEVVESLNYANQQGAAQSFDYGSRKHPLTCSASATALSFWVWIPPWSDAVDIEVETSGTGTAAPRVTVGSGTFTTTVGDRSTSIATSTTGTGWQECTFDGLVTAGTIQLDRLNITTSIPAASNLPSPPVE